MATPRVPFTGEGAPQAQPFQFWGSPVYVADDTTAPIYQVTSGDYYCPGFVGPTYATNAFDKMFIAVPYAGSSQPYTPGVCTVKVTKGREIDKKKSSGSDGARLTMHGIDPAMVEVRVVMWTPQQWRELQSLWEILFPGPTKKITTTRTPITTNVLLFDQNAPVGTTIQIPTGKFISKKTTKVETPRIPFDCDHPILRNHGIKSLVFHHGEGPDPGPHPRSMTFLMKAYEFLLPNNTNATQTPVGSKANKLDPGMQPTPGTNPGNWRP